jgi:tetratricopeptide (TPR) repeat protein
VVEAPPKLSVPYFYPEDFAGAIFVGRDDELRELHNLLQQSERVAIAAAVGMGGVGKTTLARRYVQQHREDYPGGIWWVSVSRLVTQVLEYAGKSLGLEELPTDWSEAQIVQHYLGLWESRLPGQKLLVLDDVGEYKDVKPFLPQQGAFQVLMTTRIRMQSPVDCLHLEVLQPKAALAFLKQLMADDERIQADISSAEELCQWLGYLPLGIELVGRYLADTSGSVASVLAQLQRNVLAAKPIATVPDEMDYELNVQAAIELSWQTLDDIAQQVALLLGLFALAPIKADWAVASLLDDDEAEVRACLDQQLVKRSLLNRDAEGYRLHGLVRAFLQTKRAVAEHTEQALALQQGFAEAMTAIAKTILSTVTQMKRAQLASAVPHLEEVAAKWTAGLKGVDKLWCCTGLARFYQSLNLWVEAERSAKQELEISRTELGDHHFHTASSLNNLALLYGLQGRYDEAEPLYVEALKIWKTELGDYNLDAVSSLNNLAGLYRSMGHYDKAESLYVEVLKFSESELGDCYPTSLNNLALLYGSQGRYDEAERLHVEALKIWKTELGDRHPTTATGLNNLALLHSLIGRYGEAESLYVEALEIWKAELGDRHHTTAQGLNNLALLYYNTDRLAEAAALMVEALSTWEEVFGQNHPNTLTARDSLVAIQQRLPG